MKGLCGALLGAAALLLACGSQALSQQEASPSAAPVPQAKAGQAGASLEELPPELQMVLRKLDEANGKLQSLTAKVTYERAIPLLDEKQRSQGSLVFKKPDRIILKLGEPRNEEVYTDGQTWWVVSLDDKQVEIYQTAKAGQGTQEAAFLEIGYGSGSEKLLEQYTVELVSKTEPDGKETFYRVKFTPRHSPDRPARYAAIEAVVSDKLWLPHVLVLHESGGEIIHTYTLSNIRTDTEVTDKQFEYEPPRGYTILRPQE